MRTFELIYNCEQYKNNYTKDYESESEPETFLIMLIDFPIQQSIHKNTCQKYHNSINLCFASSRMRYAHTFMILMCTRETIHECAILRDMKGKI